MKKKRFQIIQKAITSGLAWTIDEVTDTRHDRVTGVYFHIPDATGDVGSVVDLKIDGQEILPDNFPVSLLTKSTGVSVNEVALPINEAAKGSKIKGTYTDGTNAAAYPYTLSLILETEIDS